MKRDIQVHLGETPTPTASLFFNAERNRENSVFEYLQSWLTSADAFTVDPNIPLRAGQTFTAKKGELSPFPGAIADTEPDGWAKRVINRDHAKRRNEARDRSKPFDTAPLNSLDYLFAVDDFARIGALRFRDERGMFQRAAEPGRRTAPPLIELNELMRASRAVEENNESAADLRYLLGRGTSVGGLRPKGTVRDANSLLIAKFPSKGDLYSVTKGEVLALKIASAAGINAAEARLVEVDGEAVSLITRFDRTGNGLRIPYISAATLLGERDRSEDRAYTDIVDSLVPVSANLAADCEELWRRIALNILITNVDDHLANTGFLHVEKARWCLSPAFDVNPFPNKERALKTWISDTSGDAASIEALMEAAEYFRIRSDRAKEILSEVETAVSRWREIGQELEMTKIELDAFEPAIEHSERDVARAESRKQHQANRN